MDCIQQQQRDMEDARAQAEDEGSKSGGATTGDELFHWLTENDRANSMPPEITDEMYENVVDPSLFGDKSYMDEGMSVLCT